MKNRIIFLLAFIQVLFNYNFIFSQDEELLSARDLMLRMSEQIKSSVLGYEADIKWSQDDKVQLGRLYFKNPQKLRIDFTEPKGQVICTDGYELWIYIDYLNLVLHQEILKKEKEKDAQGKTQLIENPLLINPVGLDKFIKDYAIEYYENKNMVEYNDGMMVYRFKLIRWKSSQNGFNVIYLTVQKDGLIRKVEGITAAYKKIILEIDNIDVKDDISNLVFEYEPPAHANTADNFITNQGDN